MSRLRAYAYDPGDGGEDRRVLRSVTEVDALLILLTLLYLFVARSRIAHHLGYMAAIAAYGMLVVVLRRARLLEEFAHEKLVASVAAMVVFITGLLAAAGGSRGALLNLYLLPIVTAALTLGRAGSVLVLGLALAGRVGLSHFVEGSDVLALDYALALLTEALPVLLVAMLTGMLANDIQSARDRLAAKSDVDEATGLLNLQAFTRLLDEERERAGRRDQGFALLLVDIDGLKSLNEAHGMEAGERALLAVAQALKRSTRAADLVARYGGDEFVVFLQGGTAGVARLVTNRIRHNVATTTIQMGGRVHRLSVGIGAALFPDDGRELRVLMRFADRAVAADKAARRRLERPGPRGDPASVPERR